MKNNHPKKDYVQPTENSFNERQMKAFFNVLKANVVRSRTTITAIFLTVFDEAFFNEDDVNEAEKGINGFLQKMIRQTDVLYKLPNRLEWCIFLALSGEEEATAFFQRIFAARSNKNIPLFEKYEIAFSASIAEIGNEKVELEQLILNGQRALLASRKKGAWKVEYIVEHKEKEPEKIKISIIEENEIFRQVLHSSLENLAVKHFNLEIKAFQDGYEFLQTEWFSSSHTHIIIMNDILPRKNGLDILHRIRKLPNHERFHIFMMTKRKSEEDMIYAYENGVDHYLIKPFNLRLFEAQIKRTFERLWS